MLLSDGKPNLATALFSRLPALARVLAIAATFRLGVAFAPLEFLLQHVLADDAFYYYVIARNLVSGYGPTFDRLTPTNGYHPLWMFVLLGVFALFQGLSTPIYATLLLAAFLDTATVALIYTLSRRLGALQTPSLAAALIYACSPLTFLSTLGALNGLETSLNGLLISATFGMFVILWQMARFTWPAAISFGIVAGLAFLARIDNAILLGALGIALLTQRRVASDRLWLLASAAVGLALVAPWLIYCYTTFGSLIQVSGQSTAFVAYEQRIAQGWGLNNFLGEAGAAGGRMLLYTHGILAPRTNLEYLGAGLVGSGGGSLLAIAWVRRQPLAAESDERAYPNLAALVPLLLACALFIVAHTLRGVFRLWYYFSFIPLLLIGTALILDYATRRLTERSRTQIVNLAVLLVLGLQAVSAMRLVREASTSGGELPKVQVAQRLNVLLKPTDRVGAWNAGIYGYFVQRGQIINLDGLVNNTAYHHIQNHSLAGYARTISITYIVDDKGTLDRWAPFWKPGSRTISDDLEILEANPTIVIARLRQTVCCYNTNRRVF